MPGCAAVGCNNRSEKGYIMKCFPRDPKLRKIWQERVARADWEPSNNSFLCHVHFEPQEWSITQSGRIRLKKNAVPSIFTITSTRKSPKKRTKFATVKNENEGENEYTTVYVENDTEHSSVGHAEEKDSDSQDIYDPTIRSLVYRRVNRSPRIMENKQRSLRRYKGLGSDSRQQDGALMANDNDMERADTTKESVEREESNVKNKRSMNDLLEKRNSSDNQDKDAVIVKAEIKRETDQASFEDSYDEIEEKLKVICDGYREEKNHGIMEELRVASAEQVTASKRSVIQIPFHRSINYYECTSQNEIGSLLTDDAENIEIIFGAESSEEYARVPKYSPYNVANGSNKSIRRASDIDRIGNNKEMDKVSADMEDIEESVDKECPRVTSNMKAAMKRKRKTREVIMNSLKESIIRQNTCCRDTNSASDSDISDDTAPRRNETKIKTNPSTDIRPSADADDASAMTKFTVKVTGDPADVLDIMQDLFQSTTNSNLERYDTWKDTDEQRDNSLVTSVITIEDCPVKTNAKEEGYSNISLTSIDSSATSGRRDRTGFLTSKRNAGHFDEESSDLAINSERSIPSNNGIGKAIFGNGDIRYEYESLREKVSAQEDVIKKLTNQLNLYKERKDLQGKSSLLEAKTPDSGATASTTTYKKHTDSRQKSFEDLASKISYFEEMNKKLMKTVTMESQQKRKLEGQVKQRDNRIKELNWKLEKASKFLERAEKNTNTYRRKMLNMQTFMRRKKLLDEKLSGFNEMLIDGVKEGYSEKALTMAVEIKRSCGKNGYDKLLNFGFPLPPLSAVPTIVNDHFSDSNESNKDTRRRRISWKRDSAIEERVEERCRNDVEADTKDSGIPESVSMETITGTVQDIFEEDSDDGEDFNTNELREHFILQLNTVM